ncbi:MAG TPA: hypothetical protein VNM66_02270 [Thermodesulfobacteriota bacterium]|nr:hypothetical protein [Thermodesulfobacteriota bacterium]
MNPVARLLVLVLPCLPTLLLPAAAAAGSPPALAFHDPYGGRGRADRYGQPAGPTRDQTSPAGLEVQVSGLSRRVIERLPTGERFRFDVDSSRILLKATVRPARPLELYGLAGGADLDSDFEDADFDGDLGAAFGGGLRLTLFRDPEWYDTALFLEGRYLQFESEASGVPFAVDNPATPEIELTFRDERFRWREWEARFGVSWRFYLSRPYLGIRYSDVEADDIIDPGGPDDRRLTMRATRNIGGFVGLDLYFDPSRRVGLTAELSFPDYVSALVGLRIWF